jgi:hypothetical protein
MLYWFPFTLLFFQYVLFILIYVVFQLMSSNLGTALDVISPLCPQLFLEVACTEDNSHLHDVLYDLGTALTIHCKLQPFMMLDPAMAQQL